MRTVVLTGLVALVASAGAQHPDMEVAAFYVDQEHSHATSEVKKCPWQSVWSEGYNKAARTRGGWSRANGRWRWSAADGYMHSNVYKFLNALRLKAESFTPRHQFVVTDGIMLCLYRGGAMCDGDSDWDVFFETQRGYDEVFKPLYRVWRRLAGPGDVRIGSNNCTHCNQYQCTDVPTDRCFHALTFLGKSFPHDNQCQCNLPGNLRTYCWTQALDYVSWTYGNSWWLPIPHMKQSLIMSNVSNIEKTAIIDHRSSMSAILGLYDKDNSGTIEVSEIPKKYYETANVTLDAVYEAVDRLNEIIKYDNKKIQKLQKNKKESN